MKSDDSPSTIIYPSPHILPIKDRDVFADTWYDEELTGRDDECHQIIHFIENDTMLQSTCMIVHGGSGNGKSFLVRNIIRSYQQSDNHTHIIFLYVNTLEFGRNRLAKSIRQTLGLGEDAIDDEVRAAIGTSRLILIFDGLDQHKRLSEYFRNVILPFTQYSHISIIMISGSERTAHLCNYYLSHFIISTLRLHNYNEDEMVEILRHRLSAGTIDVYARTFNPALMRYIIQQVKDHHHSDMRLAINVLFTLIVNAFKAKVYPTVDMIDAIIEEKVATLTQHIMEIKWSDPHVCIFAASILHATQPVDQQALYVVYIKYCKQMEMTPHTYMWYNAWVHSFTQNKVIKMTPEKHKNIITCNVGRERIFSYLQQFLPTLLPFLQFHLEE